LSFVPTKAELESPATFSFSETETVGCPVSLDIYGKPSELYDYRNHFGEIRLKNVVGRLSLDDPENVRKLNALYSDWVLDDDYILLEFTVDDVKTIHALKASKRGNDVEQDRAEKRLRNMALVLLPYAGFGKTRLLNVTMTFGSAVTGGSIDQAWQRVREDWNRFLSALRKRYGRILVIRSWEAFKKGYPHIHAILAFEDASFDVVFDKKGKTRIRYEEKRSIAGLWHSYVDVRAVCPDGVSSSVENVLWYMIKSKREGDYHNMENWSYKRKLTLATLWYLRLRSVGVSKKLREDAAALEAASESISAPSITQTDLEEIMITIAKNSPVTVKFLGMVKRKDTEIDSDVWEKLYSGPPPWMAKAWMPGKMVKHLGDGSTRVVKDNKKRKGRRQSWIAQVEREYAECGSGD
jgi:hypothetical protein